MLPIDTQKPTTRRVITGMQPLGDQVMIQPWEAEKISKGGLELAAPEQPHIGVVTFMGPECEGTTVKVGDTVKYIDWSGEEFYIGAQRLLLMPVKNLVAILTVKTEDIPQDGAAEVVAA